MNQQATPRPHIRRRVAHDLPQGTAGTDKPDQVATTGGIAVRTELKAGTALLLQQQAAPGAAGGSVVT